MEFIDGESVLAGKTSAPVGTDSDEVQCHHDWRSCYEIRILLTLTRPCGAWIRACAAAAPRQRLLTMASCHNI